MRFHLSISGLIAGIAAAIAASLLPAGCARKPAPVADTRSLRSLPAGEIVGFTGSYGSHVWRGIPFALAPEGERRWRKPEPAPAWAGLHRALEFGSPCAQLANPFAGVVDQAAGTFAGAEDCLHLNVYAPQFGPDEVPGAGERLPVMVWIHGGGNSIGHASFYDGGRLAETQNVVVVTINYRLGPFGWFRHAALRADARDAVEASGNFGNLDQIEALRWVRRNISAFGGDPDNVTIFGESAGGRDVIALLLYPLARGLFHRAIAESGSARALRADDAENLSDAPDPGDPNSSNEILARLLVGAGRADERDAAVALLGDMDSAKISAFLRGTESATLLAAYAPDREERIPDVPNVFADGVVLPSEPPLERLGTPDGFAPVPIMLGTNRDENKIFMYANPRNVRKILGFLPRLRDEDRFNGRAAALSTAWKLAGADAPARAILRSGWSQVYVYRWDWDEEPSVLGADLSVMIGAAHGFEIPFVFGHFDLGPRASIVWSEENAAGREELSSRMMSYWTEFARAGNPGRGRPGDLVEWTAWNSTPGADKFMILDTETDGGLRMSSSQVTPESLIAQVQADPRLGSAEERCQSYREIDSWLDGIGQSSPVLTECFSMVDAK